MTTKTTLPLIEIDSVNFDWTRLYIVYWRNDKRCRVEFRGKEFRLFFKSVNFESITENEIEEMAEKFLIDRLNLKEKAENTELKKIAEKATGSLLAIILKVDEMMDEIIADKCLDRFPSNHNCYSEKLKTLKEIKDELKKLI